MPASARVTAGRSARNKHQAHTIRRIDQIKNASVPQVASRLRTVVQSFHVARTRTNSDRDALQARMTRVAPWILYTACRARSYAYVRPPSVCRHQ